MFFVKLHFLLLQVNHEFLAHACSVSSSRSPFLTSVRAMGKPGKGGKGKFAQRLQDKAHKEHAEEEKKKTGSMEPATAEELDQSKGKGP